MASRALEMAPPPGKSNPTNGSRASAPLNTRPPGANRWNEAYLKAEPTSSDHGSIEQRLASDPIARLRRVEISRGELADRKIGRTFAKMRRIPFQAEPITPNEKLRLLYPLGKSHAAP